MLLSSDEADRFFYLYRSLLLFVNQRLQVVRQVPDVEELSHLPDEERVQLRSALLEHLELLDEFVETNPAELPSADLDTVRSWRHHVYGKFLVFRHLKKHSVFIGGGKPETAFGVVGLSVPIEVLLGPQLPLYVDTLLLPFDGRIVHDGTISTFNISFGGGVKRMLDSTYKQAKERMGGVVTTLPPQPASASPAKPRQKAKRKGVSQRGKQGSATVQPVLDAVIRMTDEFCAAHLNEEYAELCRKLAQKLARKRPSPLLRGNPVTWASGIVRAIGWANFLSDPSQTPHMCLKDIDAIFGIAESTGAAKLKEIRTMLRMRRMDTEWMLPSRMDDHPLVWMLEVNGFPVDARYAPRELQEAAYKKGLIPYIPADRE